MAWLAFAGPAAASPPTAPFTECPAYGLDSSCGDLIVINAQGGLESYVDPSQAGYGKMKGGYDGEGDELIGVLNESSSLVTSIELHGHNIFGFDGKGLCSGNYPEPAGCPFGPTRYEGPDTEFSEYKEEDENEEENANTGDVNFLAGTVQPGHSAYFTLAGRPVINCQETHCETTGLSTELSGGSQSGSEVTVEDGTPVSDQATLSGSNASVATGQVTYSVYRDAGCTELVGESEATVTDGSVPAASPETFSPTSQYYGNGTYYWVAQYSGDSHNAPSQSACGSEVETIVNGTPCTKLSGRGKSASGPHHVGVKDNLNTSLSGTEKLKLSYAGGSFILKHLGSASCLIKGGERVFSGKGTGTVHGVTGYEVSFSVTLASNHTYLTAVIEKGHAVVKEFDHEKMTKNKEHIS